MAKSLTVITGASSGIGAATARAFAGAGHPLLLLARRVGRMRELDLPKAICRAVDVTDRSAVTAAVKEAEDTYGPADVLVNNAGVMLNGPAAAQDPGEWDRMIDINVRGLLNGVYAVLPGMVERRHGTIINVSSIAGRKALPGSAVYCATKHAVHASSEAIRAEAAPHDVRVIVISPGYVDTELSSHITDPDVRAAYQAQEAALEGGLTATTVADAILYAYRQPHDVCIREIALAATGQTV
ncbi:NADP-dependent 3-hydroxy acid dehydrogenase YdfG [Nocardiopsis mwathae]|uniref:NADP-dependent 3-hydroxy acid dehydrogenase YdfG n=1 Tax=Nocardiopsis mwathae TaxID=1472723 RepID=A0A7W9YKA7_9ACTN|nr:SDR family oxidoreductase [Nocardiopsis mwathae]MBB6173754.1 NADP-dependent 3-hydroxy acid dehydrogenase YdfG [Nocardiopsis mwathae]